MICYDERKSFIRASSARCFSFNAFRMQNCRCCRRASRSSCGFAGFVFPELQDYIGGVYTPSDRPEKLRAQQVTGSYLIIKGDKMLAYLTREDNSPKLFFGSSPLNDGEAALQMGVPETQKNGDVNITLRVQGNAHYRTFEWNMTLYHDSNQCFVQASKVYMAGNFSFKGRILPLSEK